MAEFIYAYRKSDGKRCEDTIKAGSRDEAFAALRKQGIRPIKVYTKNGSKANGEFFGIRRRIAAGFAFCALATGLVIGVMYERSAPEKSMFEGCNEAEKTVLSQIVFNADMVLEQMHREYAATGLEHFSKESDFVTISNNTAFIRDIEKGTAVISGAKKRMKTLFSCAIEKLPKKGAATHFFQRLYGERMAQIDAAEIAHSNRRFAFALLDGSRDKWNFIDGKIVFGDKRIGEMFRYCLSGINIDSTTTRWHQDFGGSGKSQAISGVGD
jgi:hypothetical protein